MRFLTIGTKQLNPDFILGTDGCATPGSKGVVRLYLDQRAATLFAGADEVNYIKGKTPDQPSIAELTGESAAAFRAQWNASPAMTAGSTG